MKKLLSLILSGLLVSTSAVSLPAQVLEWGKTFHPPVSHVAVRDATRVHTPYSPQVVKVSAKRLALREPLAQQIRQAVSVLRQTPGQNQEWQDFQKIYTAGLQQALQGLLKQARTKQEKQQLRRRYEQLLTPQAVRAAFERERQNSASQDAQDVVKYLTDLGRQVYALRGKVYVEDLIIEGLSVFAQVQAIDPQVKKWAAQTLRARIKQDAPACAAPGLLEGITGQSQAKDQACQRALQAAGALVVLGQSGSGSPDVAALESLFTQGYRGRQAAAVILTAGSGLYLLKDDGFLVAKLRQEALRQPDIGLLGKDFSFLVLQDYVKVTKNVLENGDWALGQEYSFYKGEGRALGNAWTDLGFFLGEEASGKGPEAARAQQLLHRVSDSTVVPSRFGGLRVYLAPFMAGALAGGYRLQALPRQGWALDKTGRSVYQDNRKEWAAVTAQTNRLRMTLTGYAATQMYFAGKSDLDPYTRLSVNNLLAKAYARSGSRAVVRDLRQRAKPTPAELTRAQNWHHVLKAAGTVDTVLAVVGTVALGVGIVKAGVAGVQGLGRVGRSLKLARLQAVRQGASFSSSYRRVLRLGRIQKYGMSGWKHLMATQSAALLDVTPSATKARPSAPAAPKASSAPKAPAAKSAKPVLVEKRGNLKTPQLTQQLRSQGGEELVNLVEKSLAKSNHPISSTVGKLPKKSKAARKAAKKAARALSGQQPAYVPFVADISELAGKEPVAIVKYFQQQYQLTPDVFKDLRRVLNKVETLPAGGELKQAVLARANDLLSRSKQLRLAYERLVHRANRNIGLRLYYLDDINNLTPATFNPKNMVLSLEEVIYPGTLNDLPAMAARVNASRIPFTLQTNGTAVLMLPKGKPLRSKDVTRLYQELLGTSFKNPALLEYQPNGSLFLRRPDGKVWLRIGEHEVANKFHLHIHTEVFLPVEGGLFGGTERVVMNYRLPMSGVEGSLRPASRLAGREAFAQRRIPVQQSPAYQIFVTDPIQELLKTGAAIQVP